jgi:uncharacterized protein (DUF362 family)
MVNKSNSEKGIARRNFLKAISVTGAGSMLITNNLMADTSSKNETASKNETLSRVVIMGDDNASDKTTKTLNKEVIQAMVDDGIMKYTGLSNVGDAWKSIFTGITASSVIGIKVNTLFNTSNVGTHPEIAYAVVNGLKQMNFDGTAFPENNIIIFDFHEQNFLAYKGYVINKTTSGVRCFQSPGYSTTNYSLPDNVNVKLSTVITDMIDFMVNIAYLKHHYISGISLCLKNHYGSIQNPNISPLLHDTGKCCNPYISAISALEPIKTKQKLCIIDAIYGLTKAGPSGPITCNPDKIIIGQDVVAVDSVGREMLKNLGLSTSDYNKTTHIDTAATTYSLGTNDLTKIEKMEVTDVKSAFVLQEIKLSNYPNPFTNSTTINFELLKEETVNLNVYDYTGKQVAKLISGKLSSGEHTIVWDGLNKAGVKIKAGVYLAELKTKTFKKTLVMQKIE